ncbi:hypothetical protein H6S82_02690 [Planktothrix sp. FACHB-1355]|uniref:Uncharacterized protein n=1 Tax=Aerosakkonema funiforme FACHB-1375 TaxID=2949571 RepID=A0A926ZHV8_9CYAN|nr:MULTISPECIES: hypothetical protein [Oscillatoriales]MBD2183054.1 hypothetical protein [Aerosakkonema funiforme FACHB-1375]MBD3557762.1 hypothetical protein [Planktothrix sp. FACHB-1355]
MIGTLVCVNLERWQLDIDYPLTVSSTGLACGESHQLDGIAVKDSAKQEGNFKSTLSRFE